MSNLVLDVGQANELKLAFRRADFSDDDIKRLCEGDVLTSVRSVLRAHASIAVIEHVIDCDAEPFLPNGWKVEEHQKGGQWKFDPKGVEFFLSNSQKGGKVIEGNKLRKELAKKPVFNAKILDYLYSNPHLIPEEWKKDEQGNTRYIFFWGTVYRDSGGNLVVRYLCWSGDGWFWSSYCLDTDWYDGNPAAVPAS